MCHPRRRLYWEAHKRKAEAHEDEEEQRVHSEQDALDHKLCYVGDYQPFLLGKVDMEICDKRGAWGDDLAGNDGEGHYLDMCGTDYVQHTDDDDVAKGMNEDPMVVNDEQEPG